MKTVRKVLKILLLSVGLLALLLVVFFGRRDIPLSELKPHYTTATSAFAPVGGMQVHYRDEGNPQDTVPLVLLHGTGASLHTFNGWAASLALERRVIRLDLPGYGLTGPFPNADYSLEAYVGFLDDFLSHLGVEQCVLGGNSLGGNIAWQYTVAHPARVQKLILIDAAGYPTQATSSPLAFRVARIPGLKQMLTYITPRSLVRSSVENVYANPALVTDCLVERYYDLTLRAGNRQAFIDRFAVKKDTLAHQRIPQITQPTLVLWGEADGVIPVANAQRFHKDLPHDTLVIMKAVGHVPMEEQPAASLVPVRAFLTDI